MKERNYSIDVLKLVCAVLVVLLHCGYAWHDAVLPLTRCAVPCFLIISGYLMYSPDKGIGHERLKRNIKHIWHIILWSTVLFAVVKESLALFHGEIFVPSIKQQLSFVFLNENPFAGHLWYLGAYLYVLLIMMVVDRHNLWKPLLWFTPLLLLGDLVLGKYSLLLLNQEFPFFYVRNFLFVGTPYFMIGVWIKMNIDRLQTVKKYVYSGGVILFALTSIMEKSLLVYLDAVPARDHYLSTTFMAICLFMFAISFKNVKTSILSRTGERDSLYIYVFHPLFIMILPMLIKRMPSFVDGCYQWVSPLIVFVLTITLILTLRKFKLIK